MSRKIIGATVGSQLPKSNLIQDDPAVVETVEETNNEEMTTNAPEATMFDLGDLNRAISQKVIGVTVGSPLPKPNLTQDDPMKGDYVKGKDEFVANILADAGKYVTPSFNLSELGMSMHTIGGRATTLVCDTTEMIDACNKGAVVLEIPTDLGVLTLVETAHATNGVWEITGAVSVYGDGDESRWIDFSVKLVESAISVKSMGRSNTGSGGSGGTSFTTDESLTLSVDNVLGVNTTNLVESDNTLPISSAGVYAALGDIEVLLNTI